MRGVDKQAKEAGRFDKPRKQFTNNKTNRKDKGKKNGRRRWNKGKDPTQAQENKKDGERHYVKMSSNKWTRQSRRCTHQLGRKQTINDPTTRLAIIHKHRDVQLEAVGLQKLGQQEGRRVEVETDLRGQWKADEEMEKRYGKWKGNTRLWEKDKMLGVAYHVIHQQTSMVRALYALSGVALQLDEWVRDSVDAMQLRKEGHNRARAEEPGDPLRYSHQPGKQIWCALLINEARGKASILQEDELKTLHMTSTTGRQIMDAEITARYMGVQLERQSRIRVIRHDTERALDSWRKSWTTALQSTREYYGDIQGTPPIGRQIRGTSMNVGMPGLYIVWPEGNSKEDEMRNAQEDAINNNMACPSCKRPMMMTGTDPSRACVAWYMPTVGQWQSEQPYRKRKRQSD